MEIKVKVEAEAFKVFSVDTRIKIIELLKSGPLAVNSLVEALGISQSAVSQHLRILKQAGLVAVSTVHEPLLGMIKARAGQWDEKGYVSVGGLNKLRNEYVMDSIKDERGELGELEKEVVDSIKNAEFISKNIYDEADSSMAFSQRIADRVPISAEAGHLSVYFL